MTRRDINQMFTDKVTELLAQGFQINAGTMSGSQGEIAHIDLRKGDEIVRVLIEREWNHSEWDYNGTIVIRVGRHTEPVRDSWDDIIWNDRLEVLSEIELARITDNYFVTPDEGAAMARKRLQRWKNRQEMQARVLTGDAFKSIALRYIRRQPRMKTCKLADIESVKRVNQSSYNRILPDLYGYEITVRGKRFLIKAPRRAER